MSETHDEPDLLAAEYVLGTLDGEERAGALARIATDAAFARAVEEWQRRLTPLSRLAEDAAAPPDLWNRIAASTWPAAAAGALQPGPRRPVRFWQASTAGALAIAAGLAAFILVRAPAPPTVAVLTPTSGAPSLLALAGPGGELTVRPAAALAPVPSGRDLELWALPAGALHPRSLGVLPASGRRQHAALPPGTRILVSLEPQGGSPSGLPTGPVLYAGQLKRYSE